MNKLNFEKEQVIGIVVLAVLVLIAGTIVFFTSTPTGCEDCMQKIKDSSSLIHDETILVKQDTVKIVSPSETATPLTASALTKLAKSVESDMDWVIEKETRYFNEVMLAKTEEEARQGFEKQVGANIFQTYLAQLSYEARVSIEQDIEISETIAEIAGEELEVIKQADVLGEDFLEQEFLEENQIEEAGVKKEFDSLMSEYIKRIKGNFFVTSDPLQQFVHAEKILELNYLFDIYS